MSTSASSEQRNKGQGSSGIQSYAKTNSKDHHDREDVESWRKQQGHHQQGYGSSDSYNNYYGSFQQQQQQQQYPNHSYGAREVNESSAGPWSNNGGGDAFTGGYESGSGGQHYNSENFSGTNNGAGGNYGNFGNQSGYNSSGYGQGGNNYGNGDYSAWGPRKQQQQQQQQPSQYDDYYRGDYGDERGMMCLEQGIGGLGLGSDKDIKELMGSGGGSKPKSWANIASQPAKAPSVSKKSKPGMPLPVVIPGAWESRNGIAKAPIAAPVQAPAWERPKIPPPAQPPPMMSHQVMPPPSLHGNQNIPPPHRSGGYQQPPMNYIPPSQSHHHQQQQPSPLQNSHNNSSHQHSEPTRNGNHSSSHHMTPVPTTTSPPAPKYPDELKMKDYNPTTFDLMAEGARFFVIKSYSEDDIHRSIKYEIWCSTEHGNKRLDEAFKEREAAKGLLYLLFSVNGSGHFCGMAQMISPVDYHAKASVWSQDKWKGQFKVKWIYVKDVPNAALRHIRLENNENKPVTNSRDTQEAPFEKGKQVLKIMHSYHHTTSIFDDFIHYEKRQEEEDQRKTVVQSPPPPPMMQQQQQPSNQFRNERGGGRGGFHDRGGGGFRGGNHHGPPPNHHQRGDYDTSRGGGDNGRDFRDLRGSGRGDAGYMHPRNDFRGDQPYNPQRDDRDRDFRGGHRGRPQQMMRN